MRIDEMPADGTIIARCEDRDEEWISVAVTMPAACWDQLTADLRDLDRDISGDSDAPDATLEMRIAMFIDLEVGTWRMRCSEWQKRCGEDLDEDVPF